MNGVPAPWNIVYWIDSWSSFQIIGHLLPFFLFIFLYTDQLPCCDFNTSFWTCFVTCLFLSRSHNAASLVLFSLFLYYGLETKKMDLYAAWRERYIWNAFAVPVRWSSKCVQKLRYEKIIWKQAWSEVSYIFYNTEYFSFKYSLLIERTYSLFPGWWNRFPYIQSKFKVKLAN